MKKGLIIALAVLMVFGLTTVALADALPPYIGGAGSLVTTETINWNASGRVWGDTEHIGVSKTTFDTAGAGVNGSYHTEVWNTTALGCDFDLMGVRFQGNVTADSLGGYVEVTQDRYGPSPLWRGTVAPGGQSTYSRIDLWEGTATLDTTTSTGGYGALIENNLGRAPGSASAEFRVDTDVTTGWYNIVRNRQASDTDRVNVWAYGWGKANLESLRTDMGPSAVVCGYALYPKGFSFDGVTGGGYFEIEGFGHNQVCKENTFVVTGAPIAFSSTGSINFGAPCGIENLGTGAVDSANLKMYTPFVWTGSFNITNYGMIAN